MLNLIDKKALITGGVGGIGQAITYALAKNKCKVIIFDILGSGHEIVERMNNHFDEEMIFYSQIDLRNVDLINDRLKHLCQEYGPVNYLINNAGIDTIGKIEEMTDELYQDTQQINASPAFLLSRELIQSMKKLGGGSIVNILSIILSGGWENRVPYSMSKGSLLGLTRALAREVGQYNIRVNAVSPGAIPTSMEKKFWKEDRGDLDRFIMERQALKYRGSVDDI